MKQFWDATLRCQAAGLGQIKVAEYPFVQYPTYYPCPEFAFDRMSVSQLVLLAMQGCVSGIGTALKHTQFQSARADPCPGAALLSEIHR